MTKPFAALVRYALAGVLVTSGAACSAVRGASDTTPGAGGRAGSSVPEAPGNGGSRAAPSGTAGVAPSAGAGESPSAGTGGAPNADAGAAGSADAGTSTLGSAGLGGQSDPEVAGGSAGGAVSVPEAEPPCPSGSWAVDEGERHCRAWTICAAGSYVSRVGSAAYDRECSACVSGATSAGPNAGACVATCADCGPSCLHGGTQVNLLSGA